MFERIRVLKERGYEPDLIIDAGAHMGNWTKSMSMIYPDCQYFLFESIDYPELKKLESSSIKVFNVTLDSEPRKRNWYQMKNTGDSFFRENTKVFDKCEIIEKETTTLDNQIGDSNYGKILMKIDCQGSELEILKGSKNILSKTDFILMETPFIGEWNEGAPSFFDCISFMDKIGFTPYEIVEEGRANINGTNYLIHLDMIFIRKKHQLNLKIKEVI
jgi:FkbM family methyltransferase